jgi:hypothetical protein
MPCKSLGSYLARHSPHRDAKKARDNKFLARHSVAEQPPGAAGT